jgi:predicted PurR-regulated permease PerM
MLIEFVGIEIRMEKGLYSAGSPMHRFVGLSKDTRKYLGITGLVGLAQAVVNTIALAFLGIDFAVTFGVLFFFCNFIPAVGFFIAVVPPVFIALLDHNWKRALIVLLTWWAINFVCDNILRPKFMKEGLDIPILHIIMGLIVWSWVLGPIGAILAIPLTMTITRLIQMWGQPASAGHS